MASAKLITDVITKEQLHKILEENVGSDSQMIDYDMKPLSEGLSGFLGDHFKLTLYVKDGELTKTFHLFIKTVPRDNKPKAEFIDNYKYFSRESLIFKLISETGAAKGNNSFCSKAYVYNDDVIVMPDLSIDGYIVRPVQEYFDLDHVLVTLRSLARFHATIANNFTQKSIDGTLHMEIKGTTTDSHFVDSPWLRAAIKLTANFLKEFSVKGRDFTENFDEEVANTYIEACDELREYPESLNVLIHRDTWANNIMFRYKDSEPINAVLIDFQYVRYAPPAFDVLLFLYFTTSRKFRKQNEVDLLSYYFSIFNEHLNEKTRTRVDDMDYNLESFLSYNEIARKYVIVHAISILPYVLLDALVAKKVFDDPETFHKHMFEDRSEPILAHAHQYPRYKDRILELGEEFVEKYVSSVQSN